jgi:hypothetical protein
LARIIQYVPAEPSAIPKIRASTKPTRIIFADDRFKAIGDSLLGGETGGATFRAGGAAARVGCACTAADVPLVAGALPARNCWPHLEHCIRLPRFSSGQTNGVWHFGQLMRKGMDFCSLLEFVPMVSQVL